MNITTTPLSESVNHQQYKYIPINTQQRPSPPSLVWVALAIRDIIYHCACIILKSLPATVSMLMNSPPTFLTWTEIFKAHVKPILAVVGHTETPAVQNLATISTSAHPVCQIDAQLAGLPDPADMGVNPLKMRNLSQVALEEGAHEKVDLDSLKTIVDPLPPSPQDSTWKITRLIKEHPYISAAVASAIVVSAVIGIQYLKMGYVTEEHEEITSGGHLLNNIFFNYRNFLGGYEKCHLSVDELGTYTELSQQLCEDLGAKYEGSPLNNWTYWSRCEFTKLPENTKAVIELFKQNIASKYTGLLKIKLGTAADLFLRAYDRTAEHASTLSYRPEINFDYGSGLGLQLYI